MSHYYAEQMFSPVLLSPVFKVTNLTMSDDEVEVYIISELFEEISNLQLEISVQRFDNLLEAYVKRVTIGKFFPSSI